jgi:hypothetical protein
MVEQKLGPQFIFPNTTDIVLIMLQMPFLTILEKRVNIDHVTSLPEPCAAPARLWGATPPCLPGAGG